MVAAPRAGGWGKERGLRALGVKLAELGDKLALGVRGRNDMDAWVSVLYRGWGCHVETETGGEGGGWFQARHI